MQKLLILLLLCFSTMVLANPNTTYIKDKNGSIIWESTDYPWLSKHCFDDVPFFKSDKNSYTINSTKIESYEYRQQRNSITKGFIALPSGKRQNGISVVVSEISNGHWFNNTLVNIINTVKSKTNGPVLIIGSTISRSKGFALYVESPKDIKWKEKNYLFNRNRVKSIKLDEYSFLYTWDAYKESSKSYDSNLNYYYSIQHAIGINNEVYYKN